MESKTKNKKSRETIEAMVRRSFQGIGLKEGEDAITELKQGWFNVAYDIKLEDGRETILKIAPPVDAEVLTYEKNIMRTEAETMIRVGKETEVKVPEVYYYDDKKDLCDSDYFFMEKLSGRNYEHVKADMTEEANRNINLTIGRCQYLINTITASPYYGYDGNSELRGSTWREAFLKMISSVLEDGKRKQIDIGCSYEEFESLLEKYAPYLDVVTTPHLVHWDCWDSNVFVDNGELVGILDFERAFWGDILIETLFRLQEPNQLKGYGKTEFTLEETVRCKLYDAYLFLIMIVECYYRNYDEDWTEKYARAEFAKNLAWLRDGEKREL